MSAESPSWDNLPLSRQEFIDLVRAQGRARYRSLPWRNVDDPYAVLVSEVMLQQTQVKRVLSYWPRFMESFPTVDALAQAPTAAVLEAWQGLGYNRRALALKHAAEACAQTGAGTLPADYDRLVALPGVGPATAAGVLSFAFQKPAVYIETNVRTVFLHCLFPDQMGVSDKTLRPYVVDACPTYTDGEGFGPRAWYYALLDFGAFLKTQVANPSRRSAQYTRQSAFEGSNRQKRSFLVRLVLARPEGIELAQAARALSAFEQDHGRAPVQGSSVEALADQLAAEGFFHREGSLLIP